MRNGRRVKAVQGVVVAAFVACLGMASSSAAPASAACASSVVLGVTNLKIDDLPNPLGIDDTTPSLSWQLTSPRNGERQTAYRILVASSPDRLAAGSADVWDSGKIASDASISVAYGGPALQAMHRDYWTVQAWDVDGSPSPWAEPAWWETGLLDASHWQGAQWIGQDTADQESWTDFAIDVDFTIRKGAASVVFRAQDANNLYMWQVNAEINPGKVLLRPHVEVMGPLVTWCPISISAR